MAELTLFDILKDINMGKSYKLCDRSEFEKVYNDFMVNRYLSMSIETVMVAEFMNVYNKIPKKAKYLFLTDAVEKKNRFLKYIKADKDTEDAKLLKYIMEVYSVSKNEALMLSQTINETEKKRIKACFETNPVKKR